MFIKSIEPYYYFTVKASEGILPKICGDNYSIKGCFYYNNTFGYQIANVLL